MAESAPASPRSSPALESPAAALFAALGARPVINAAGAYTLLGGSRLSPGVRAAMEQANRYFADMRSLLVQSGDLIARLLDAEAALVTSGAAASLALAAAACLTLHHPEYLERLPDSEGIPNEVITQRATRQRYDRCLTLTGARLVECGEADATTAAQLRRAIGPKTAALHYYVPPAPRPGVLPLEAVLEVAREHRLPVIVDAAGRTYPVDELRLYARMGADLVCYAAKYFDAPHSTGLLCGRRDLIDSALLNSFIGFETSPHLTVGRAMKVDRQEVFATVVALQEWLATDHEARLLRYGERIAAILAALDGLPAVLDVYRISSRETPSPVVRDGVRVHLDPALASAQAVFETLRDGEPSIWVRVADGHANALQVSVAFFEDEDLPLVASRLRSALVQG